MATYTKQQLSGSTSYRGILVAATATPGTIIHTASPTDVDEVWLYAYNSSGSAVLLTIEYGGTTVPNDNIKISIPPTCGLVPVVVGIPIKDSLVIRAFAATANVIVLFGFVNRISQ
jgi:hypothetical protein